MSFYGGVPQLPGQNPFPPLVSGDSFAGVLHLSAPRLLESSTGTKISTWYDSSGNKNDFTNAVFGTLPAEGAAQNGLIPIRFTNAASTVLTSSFILRQIFRTASDYCFWVVFTARAVNASSPTQFYQSDIVIEDSFGNWGLNYRNNGGLVEIAHYNFTGAAFQITPVQNITVGTWYVARIRKTAGNIYLALNQGAETSIACGALSSVASSMQLGKSSVGGSTAADIDIGEVIGLPFSPGSQILKSITGTLMTNWGL